MPEGINDSAFVGGVEIGRRFFPGDGIAERGTDERDGRVGDLRDNVKRDSLAEGEAARIQRGRRSSIHGDIVDGKGWPRMSEQELGFRSGIASTSRKPLGSGFEVGDEPVFEALPAIVGGVKADAETFVVLAPGYVAANADSWESQQRERYFDRAAGLGRMLGFERHSAATDFLAGGGDAGAVVELDADFGHDGDADVALKFVNDKIAAVAHELDGGGAFERFQKNCVEAELGIAKSILRGAAEAVDDHAAVGGGGASSLDDRTGGGTEAQNAGLEFFVLETIGVLLRKLESFDSELAEALGEQGLRRLG